MYFVFKRNKKNERTYHPTPLFGLESLESRRMLSASHPGFFGHPSHAPSTLSSHHSHGHVTTTSFSALQTSAAAAANGLTTLATADNQTITGAQVVTVRTVNSTTTYYSVTLTSTGSRIKLTVDQTGAAVTPTSSSNTTTFSALQTSDAAAAAGLTKLAAADGQTIAGTQVVSIRTLNSTTTDYTVVLTPSTGTRIRLTVDQTGAPVSAPTTTSTTFGNITNTLVTAEITKIATGLNLTGLSPATSVTVHTAQGVTTYTVSLASSTSTTTSAWDNTRITVNDAGNPAGNQTIPFSTLPGGIAGGLTTLAAASSQSISGTQNVFVRTVSGAITYTVNLTGTAGQSLQLTVDQTGAPASPPMFGGFGDGGGGRGDRHGGFGDLRGM